MQIRVLAPSFMGLLLFVSGAAWSQQQTRAIFAADHLDHYPELKAEVARDLQQREADIGKSSVKPIRLRDDADPALFVFVDDPAAAQCGQHPNCPIYVFRRSHRGYVLLLSGAGGTLDLDAARHHGYRDIHVRDYMGLSSFDTYWSYDGAKYQEARCIGNSVQPDLSIKASTVDCESGKQIP